MANFKFQMNTCTNFEIIKFCIKKMKPTRLFLALFFTITASSLAWAMEPDPDNSYSRKLKAQDAITLSINELHGIKDFAKSIPRLKILQVTHQNISELDICVNSLVNDLDSMKSMLHRMGHMKRMDLPSDANSLEREMAHGVNIGKACAKSFQNVDEIVHSVLTRKLSDLSMVINAVVLHVSEMEQDGHRK